MAGARVVIFETQIHRMFRPGGMVHREAKSAARDVARDARIFAPSRSGRLKRSIRVRSETRASRTVVGFYVSADAPWAYFVHEGTRGHSGRQRIPKVRQATGLHGYELPDSKVSYRWYRRGQKSNPFLMRSLSKNVAATTSVRTAASRMM